MKAITGMLAGAALALGLGGAVQAGERLVVIELYTSQGCSSCPPADDLLTRLAARSDVLLLALHVDYWDYIGWADSFANPAFTRRQKAYGRIAGARSVYTPQMVVGGVDHLVGNKEMELGELIMRHGAGAAPVALTLLRRGGKLVIRAVPQGALPGNMMVQLVRYTPSETVDIRRGENAGRSIVYTNIVTEWREIGRWNGRAALEMETNAPGSQPAAVIVQEEGPGAILAAAVLR